MEPLESGIRQKRVAEALRVFQLLDSAGKLAFFDLVRARECPNETNDDEEAS